MGNIPLMGELILDMDAQWHVFDYVMWCGFTVNCEYGAGQWVTAQTTYRLIRRIADNPQKKFVLLPHRSGSSRSCIRLLFST